MGTAIVVIPRDDDHVWKISSEKIPHMTLLYLGDVSAEDHEHIALFLQHVAETSMFRFGFSVDKRGTLGDEEADVLFFEKNWAKDQAQIRGYLLANDTIKKYFDAAPQFEGWTPHLTLGYPSAPAKEDDRDFAISYVSFDKIALWTGDFDGPTFELPDRWQDEVAWSADAAARGADAIAELAHYGVPGMRWGIRKNDSGGNTLRTLGRKKPEPSEDKAAANESAAKIGKKGNTDALSNVELQKLVNRMNLEQQYARLSASPDKLAAGNKKAKDILDTVKTGQRVYKMTPTPVKTKIGNALKKPGKKLALATAVALGKAAGKRAARRG